MMMVVVVVMMMMMMMIIQADLVQCLHSIQLQA
jgi:hypothetical protein